MDPLTASRPRRRASYMTTYAKPVVVLFTHAHPKQARSDARALMLTYAHRKMLPGTYAGEFHASNDICSTYDSDFLLLFSILRGFEPTVSPSCVRLWRTTYE